jgi:hypothetical protein
MGCIGTVRSQTMPPTEWTNDTDGSICLQSAPGLGVPRLAVAPMVMTSSGEAALGLLLDRDPSQYA